MSDTAKESNSPRPQLWPAAYCSSIPERVSISITKTKIKVFWPYCGMFRSVMQLLSRCAEGGWVSKHTAQQIGKEEHQQSTAAMLLTDCSDNRQGKHSHREGKKRWRGCTEREERRRGSNKKGGWEQDRRNRPISVIDVLSICFNHSESRMTIYTSCDKQDRWNLSHKKWTPGNGWRTTGVDAKIRLRNNSGNTCTIILSGTAVRRILHLWNLCVWRLISLCQRGRFSSVPQLWEPQCMLFIWKTLNILINIGIQLKGPKL